MWRRRQSGEFGNHHETNSSTTETRWLAVDRGTFLDRAGSRVRSRCCSKVGSRDHVQHVELLSGVFSGAGDVRSGAVRGLPFQPPKHVTMSDSASGPAESTGRRQVVVTGIGLVTPFGDERETSWSAICQGRSAVQWFEQNDHGNSGPLGRRWVGASAPARFLASAEPVVSMAVFAAREALSHAALSRLSEQAGCVIGTSKLGLRSFSKAMKTSDSSDPALPWPNAAARAVASEWNLRGPALCPVAACATGLVSLVRGADLIRSGECDVVLAGSSDASLVPIVLGSFQRLGVMAREFESPATACRPFDAERSGFVIGEGAAVLVLEDREHAVTRGANILAQFIAGGMASDPCGMTQVDPAGTSLAWLIRDVLRRAHVAPDEIDAINLHGTATRANDIAESRAVHAVFGSAADRLACSSQKGAIGHLLGAAGSVESAIAVLSMRDQIVPPTINLRTPDPQCDLDYVPNESRPMRLRTVLKLSLGFGGHVAVGLFRAP
ncbi:MAG: beta-ketoacyl-[acyl-carrier-protein] synthase family protein [Planctomycetes bacterium]|nr:beta-ketoacyl-[acyl-carrier-protein] synthase family protein [Planctomycetota bacterium]